MPEANAEVVLRDYKPENLEAARKLAAEFGLANVTIIHGDAFDAAFARRRDAPADHRHRFGPL